ncbi:MAG: exodeoxyribonuclease VII large subunit [Dehalococcoidia bacterium]|nr:exodeoxyribonuclease VII large subunit [Dehalococcoidia bacterium]
MESYFHLEPENKVYRLQEITSLIKQSLLDLSSREFWIRAHLIVPKSSATYRNYYCELIDVDELGSKTAQIRAIIWQPEYSKILNKLRRAGMPDALQDNSEVCVLCAVRYHEVYGLNLNIYDIDPSFGESQIDLNRRQIIEKLSKENVLKKNAETYLAVAPLRIGLITREESAAYNDFTKTLFNSPFSFKVIVADCTMQGESTESETVSAVRFLTKTKVDVICIVRGGGSQLDLAWFDNERIARSIINCPIPVWVGMGHEIDTGVLDVVAHSSFKTPTAVAEALVNTLQELLHSLEFASERLQNTVDRRLELSGRELSRMILGACNGFRKQQELVQQRFSNGTLRVSSQFEERFSSKEIFLDNANQELRRLCDWSLNVSSRRLIATCKHITLPRYLKILAEWQRRLAERERQLLMLMPEQILRKGYTITRNLRSEIVRSIAQLQGSEVIETQFIDGYVRSIVQKTEDTGNETEN